MAVVKQGGGIVAHIDLALQQHSRRLISGQPLLQRPLGGGGAADPPGFRLRRGADGNLLHRCRDSHIKGKTGLAYTILPGDHRPGIVHIGGSPAAVHIEEVLPLFPGHRLCLLAVHGLALGGGFIARHIVQPLPAPVGHLLAVDQVRYRPGEILLLRQLARQQIGVRRQLIFGGDGRHRRPADRRCRRQHAQRRHTAQQQRQTQGQRQPFLAVHKPSLLQYAYPIPAKAVPLLAKWHKPTKNRRYSSSFLGCILIDFIVLGSV